MTTMIATCSMEKRSQDVCLYESTTNHTTLYIISVLFWVIFLSDKGEIMTMRGLITLNVSTSSMHYINMLIIKTCRLIILISSHL